MEWQGREVKMSRSTSSSSSRTSCKCNCGVPLALVKSWTTDNPGRRFLTCKFYNPSTQFRGCQYFKWFDEEQCQWQKDVINQLLLDKKLLKCESEMLKVENEHLIEQKKIMSEEIEMLNLKLKLGEKQMELPSNGSNEGHFTLSTMFKVGFVLVVVVVLVKLFGR
ncbi:hypothetical protein RND81_07G034400 [Saponaria officinalis]|uniref:GRF-type domain-containing protein n=1 Tax=Saponaria officinalis TaxID=3572 RepID=A0AAW1JMN1_SAPOF